MKPARSPCCKARRASNHAIPVPPFALYAASVYVPGQHRPIRCPKYELLLGNAGQSIRAELRAVAQTGTHCMIQTREHNITSSAERNTQVGQFASLMTGS